MSEKQYRIVAYNYKGHTDFQPTSLANAVDDRERFIDLHLPHYVSLLNTTEIHLLTDQQDIFFFVTHLYDGEDNPSTIPTLTWEDSNNNLVICAHQGSAYQHESAADVTDKEKLVIFIPNKLRQWITQAAQRAGRRAVPNFTSYTTVTTSLSQCFALLDGDTTAEIWKADLCVQSRRNNPPCIWVTIYYASRSEISFVLSIPTR